MILVERPVVDESRGRGFTLVEILIAIALVGVLSAVVVVGVGNLTSKGAEASCAASLDASRTAAITHLTSAGASPTTFTQMVSSGSLVLPAGVTVDASGTRLTTSSWRLTMTAGQPPTFVCGAAPAASDLDLAGLAVQPSAAFSLRRIVAAFTGPAITVRRTSDNSTADIGFTAGGDLDTAALLAFVGSSSGHVTTWYDQSGNARNATQLTTGAQPRIVNAGVLETQNGKPAVRFTRNVSYLGTSTLLSGTSHTIDIVFARSSPVGNFDVLVGNASTDYFGFVPSSGNVLTAAATQRGFVHPETTTAQVAINIRSGATASLYVNGTTAATNSLNSLGTGSISLSGVGGFNPFGLSGTITEVVFIGAAVDASARQALEASQIAYWSIS